MSNQKKKEKPNWHSSRYRGYWDWKKKKFIIAHDKPMRCPYCGNVMSFASPIFYQYSTSDWYWCCTECHLTLPNLKEFKKEKLDRARKRWRKELEEKMKETREKYRLAKKLYKTYGKYFTPEEKRERLIETLEEYGKLRGDI